MVMVLPGGRERWSDRELLSAIADRDPEAFSVFYRRHLPGTVAFLLRETHIGRLPQISRQRCSRR